MERQQHLPVVEVGHALVDLVDRDELYIRRVISKDRDNRLRQAVIEREQPAPRRQLHQAAAALRLR